MPDTPRRAVFVTPFMTRGGTETFVRELATRLRGPGCRTAVIAGPGHEGERFIADGGLLLPVDGLASRRPSVWFRAAGALGTALGRLRVDVVVSQSFLACAAVFLALRLRRRRMRHVFILHIPERRWYYRIMGWSLRRMVDRVITVCVTTRLDLIRHGVPASLTTTVLNGVDTDRFAFRLPTNHDGPFRLGSVARLVPRKGHRYLIDALSRLRERGAPAFSWDVFGDGPEREALVRQVAAAGLDDVVRFHGACDDVHSALAEIDCLVAPSTSEGLPIILLEAMSAGVPVVATRVDGVPEVVIDGLTGILIPPRDPEALADAVSRMADSVDRRRLARSARRWVQRRFSIDGMVDSYRHELLGAP